MLKDCDSHNRNHLAIIVQSHHELFSEAGPEEHHVFLENYLRGEERKETHVGTHTFQERLYISFLLRVFLSIYTTRILFAIFWK